MTKIMLFTLFFVSVLVMTLAGGCVPTVIADGARPPEEAIPAVASLDEPQKLERVLDELIAGRMVEYDIPSETVAVVWNGQVVFLKGYGHADPAKQTPVDPEQTLFRIGSVSKLFVWTAVMQLAEQGKLDLHADVNAYLQEAGGNPALRIPDSYPQPVTLAHLLTHTSGFEKQDFGDLASSAQKWIPLEEYLTARMPRRVYPPGQVLVYSNYGTSLAAYIVEQVSGMPFEEYVERFIYDPLGMQHSTFRQPLPSHLSGDLATGVQWQPGRGHGEPAEFEWMHPSGAMSSTAADMARFMIAHLQNGRYEDGGQSAQGILDGATAAMMHSQQFTYDPRLPGFTFGFFEEHVAGTRVIYHAGGSTAFSAHLALIPEHDLGIFEAYSGGEPGSGFIYATLLAHLLPHAGAWEPESGISLPAGRFVGEYLDVNVNYSTPEKLLALIKGMSVRPAADGTLSCLGGTWVQVEPFLFGNLQDGDLALFRTEDGTPTGRVTYLIHDQIAYERLPWYRRTAFQLGLPSGCLLIFLSVILGWPVASLVRRQHRREPALLPKLARWAGMGMSLVFVGFALAFAVEVYIDDVLIYGLTSASRAILTLPLLGAVLAAGTLVMAGAAWMGWGASSERPYWRLPGRVHYTLLAVAGVAFSWWLGCWNLLGAAI